jgi:hypothetical protein
MPLRPSSGMPIQSGDDCRSCTVDQRLGGDSSRHRRTLVGWDGTARASPSPSPSPICSGIVLLREPGAFAARMLSVRRRLSLGRCILWISH